MSTCVIPNLSDTMNKRPLSIAVLGWIFIAFGAITIIASAVSGVDTPSQREALSSSEAIPILAARLLAIFCGVFLLLGFNWARYVLIVWILYHVILSLFHPPFEIIAHSLLLIVAVYVLFRPQASAYFRGAKI